MTMGFFGPNTWGDDARAYDRARKASARDAKRRARDRKARRRQEMIQHPVRTWWRSR